MRRLRKAGQFATTLTKGAHVAIEGELRSHEYRREVALGTQTTSIPQRVWGIRVDSVLKLDRSAKCELNDDSDQEVPPLRRISLTTLWGNVHTQGFHVYSLKLTYGDTEDHARSTSRDLVTARVHCLSPGAE
jgi:hypothetical protein